MINPELETHMNLTYSMVEPVVAKIEASETSNQ